MKIVKLLAFSAAIVLSAFAVWFGSLNQDEGWYLYAARMVSEGYMPYRDFFYTQGPLMPIVYSLFGWVWNSWGLLGARIMTAAVGLISIFFSVALARRLVPDSKAEQRCAAGMIVFLTLACNLYHLYYVAIPKTYALASLFVVVGFYLYSFVDRRPAIAAMGSAFVFALAAGTRISLGAILAIVGITLLVRRRWRAAAFFALGGALALAIVYGPFLFDAGARAGLVAAQQYHASRGGYDIVWTVGSISRLVRWYLPIFVVLVLGFGIKASPMLRTLAAAFAAVFAVQMMAPFPYEDYQVPVMALVAVYAAVKFAERASSNLVRATLLTMAMAFCCSFGSPLLEKWMTNGQDRFWSIKKEKSELAQLREVARIINQLDPDGKDLLTQDTYLAIETGRRVPRGLEMGPFSMLTDEQWKRLINDAPCRIAAMSGYTFAVEPPRCNERAIEKQLEYWKMLKKKYRYLIKEDYFGQNATTLLVMERIEK